MGYSDLDPFRGEVKTPHLNWQVTKLRRQGAMVGLFEYNLPACYQALKQAGKLGKIKLVGFDENDVTLQGIKKGFVTGTIVQNPYQYGYQSVKVLKDFIEGKDNLDGRDYIDIVARKITKENVDAYWTKLKRLKAGHNSH